MMRAVLFVALLSAAVAVVARQDPKLVQLKQQVLDKGVVCEDMCKKVLEYPKCQCPGFGSMPADDDDTRSCEAKYCHPPADRCPNDAFFTCVQETTGVGLLQTTPEVSVLEGKVAALQAAIAGYKARV